LICLDNSTEFYQLGNFIHDKGIDVTYITSQVNSDEQNIDNNKANKVIRVPTINLKPDEIIRNTVNIFKQEVEKPGLIHSMNWISGAAAYEIIKKFKLRHLHSFLSLGRENIKDMNNMNDEESYRDNCELKIFESAEWIISQTAFLGKKFFELYPKIFHQKLIVIPYGVDHQKFKPSTFHQDEPDKIFGKNL
jgi:glycosyltransferase involved in cell wall biosynthesis